MKNKKVINLLNHPNGMPDHGNHFMETGVLKRIVQVIKAPFQIIMIAGLLLMSCLMWIFAIEDNSE